MKQVKEIYICNGRKLHSYDEVIKYSEKNNYRITNTETLRKNVYLISVLSNDFASQVKNNL